MERSSGILLPIFSLPSLHGIGTLGQAARDFIVFLGKAGQRWWQILPVGPTSVGDSPYQSLSAFAGNPYFIDLDELATQGLLTKSEIASLPFGDDPARVDYALLYKNRFILLEKAFERGWEQDKTAVETFSGENEDWLPDYALYMAVKKHFGMSSWQDWPEEAIRLHKPDAVAHYRKKLERDVRFYTYLQFLFYQQWDALKEYAKSRQIGIIGDLPIYVSLDSADVWADPENFQLDECNRPREVSGVPPDGFSEDGQLWSNPLYDYEAMAQDGYRWWLRRIRGAMKLYDIIRIDHFRGFESYWAVPYGAETARNGRWIKGPGMELVALLRDAFPNLSYIAEDLGYPSREVRELLAASGFPGMKLLEFSFSVTDENPGLPHTFAKNSVCYIGTHDNPPVMGWKESGDPAEIILAKEYANIHSDADFARGILRIGMGSPSELFIAQLQDWLELGNESRINRPGTSTGNWLWRSTPGALSDRLAEDIARMTKLYGRSKNNGSSQSETYKEDLSQ